MLLKNAKKCQFVQKSVKKARFHSNGATIRTRRESRFSVCKILKHILHLYPVQEGKLLDLDAKERPGTPDKPTGWAPHETQM